MLLFQGNPFQHRVYLTSANAATTLVYNLGNQVTSYFNLRTTNDDLNATNARLLAENANLRQQVAMLEEKLFTDTLVPGSLTPRFSYRVGRVINNSIFKPHNYITIDKGSADGIAPEQGVIDRNGVVGIIANVNTHSSRAMSLLNPDFRLSCKLKGTDINGSLVWDGEDPSTALLEELPRQTVYKQGDTVVTSGYSTVFPAGLPVGTVIDDGKKHQENFFTLRIKLFADFSSLSNVQIVSDNFQQEIRETENPTPIGKEPEKNN